MGRQQTFQEASSKGLGFRVYYSPWSGVVSLKQVSACSEGSKGWMKEGGV